MARDDLLISTNEREFILRALRENFRRSLAARTIQQYWRAHMDRFRFLKSRLAASCQNWAEHLEACERAKNYSM